MDYLDWCNHFHTLKRHLEDTLKGMGYHAFFSNTLQPSIGFDPTNTIYQLANGDLQERYLRTSPEREMKMALAHSHTSLFEIGKVFRGGPENQAPPYHIHEFWMCEFYKVNATLPELIADIEYLLTKCWQAFRKSDLFIFEKMTFEELFQTTTGHNLTPWLQSQSPEAALEQLDFIYADKIQPELARRPGFTLITDFPYPMCALAKEAPHTRTLPDAHKRFLRAELSTQGLELLNAYEEIETLPELKTRLEQTLAYQRHQQQNNGPLCDVRYEHALKKGLPKSSGCALGCDRLLMILLKSNQLMPHTTPSGTSGSPTVNP